MPRLVKPALWKASRATTRHQDVNHSALAAQRTRTSVRHQKAPLGAVLCKAARQTVNSHVQYRQEAASWKATRPQVTHSLTADRAEELRLEAASCKATRPNEAPNLILDRAGVDTKGHSQVEADVMIVIVIVIGANAKDVTRVKDTAAEHQQQ